MTLTNFNIFEGCESAHAQYLDVFFVMEITKYVAENHIQSLYIKIIYHYTRLNKSSRMICCFFFYCNNSKHENDSTLHYLLCTNGQLNKPNAVFWAHDNACHILFWHTWTSFTQIQYLTFWNEVYLYFERY